MSIKAKPKKNGKRELKNLVQKTIQQKYATVLRTERLFAEMLIKAHDAGLIKLHEKSYNNLKGFIGVMQYRPTQELLHSKDNTHGKMRKLISTGDHAGPMQQQQDSSMRVNEVAKQLSVAKKLMEAEADLTGNVSGDIYSTMLTLTRPNTHKGKLKADFKKHRDRVTKLIKALSDGANRGNGVLLIGGKYVGAFVAHELTVNSDLIDQKAVHSIYHPHTHIVILSDGPIDIDAMYDILLDKWRALNPDLSLSADGFDYRDTYDKNAPKGSKSNNISAVKEAVKYSIKPDTWNDLVGADSYSVEVFAEVYSVMKGVKAKRSYGVMREAKAFMRLFSRFENAMAFSAMDSFPDIVTQLSELVATKNKKIEGYNAVYKRELNADEVLYYNRSLIEGLLVTPRLEAYIEDFFEQYDSKINDHTKRVYSEVFQSYTFGRTFEELVEKLEKFQAIETGLNNIGKAYDIGVLINSMDEVRSRKVDMDQALEISTSSHTSFVKKEREKYTKLFQRGVGPLTGAGSTLQNNYVYECFISKQGLADTGKTEQRVQLFVEDSFGFFHSGYRGATQLSHVGDKRMREITFGYLGEAFFGDDWKNVK